MMGFLNLKRIALAMLIYERDHRTLPPAYTVDADGTPLHSWRVLLLPYLGQVPQSAAEQGSHRHGSQSRPAPSNGIGSHHPYGAIFGLRNGAAEFLSYSMDLEAFNQMLRGTHEDRYRSY